MSATWLTVVTAVRDDEPGLIRTMESLRHSDLDGVDVLVVDSSSDRAVAPAVAAGIARSLWTEPRGVYPAMNIGLENAVGEYVYYLNAGDTLHHAEVLVELRQAVEHHHPYWMFGSVEIIGTDGSATITPRWDYDRQKAALFARGHFPPHQGTVVRTATLRAMGGFDTSYRIAADYAAFLRLSVEADPVILPFVLATFREGGVSTQRWQESFREFHRARRTILQPRGLSALRERVDTAWHFGRVFAYREVALRARR